MQTNSNLCVYVVITNLVEYLWHVAYNYSLGILAYNNQALSCMGTCKPGHSRALPRLFWIIHTHITRTRRKDTWSPAYSICVHRLTHSIQCSDKIRFPQLCIKCSVAKSCPGTHTALQVPMPRAMPSDSHGWLLNIKPMLSCMLMLYITDNILRWNAIVPHQ